MHAGVSKLLTDAPCDVTKSRSSLLPSASSRWRHLVFKFLYKRVWGPGWPEQWSVTTNPKRSQKRHFVARRLTTGRWSLRTRGRIGRPAAAGTPRPPPAWAAGTECPMSRRGISEWPARSAEGEDAEVGNAAKLVRPDRRTRGQFTIHHLKRHFLFPEASSCEFCVDRSLQHASTTAAVKSFNSLVSSLYLLLFTL